MCTNCKCKKLTIEEIIEIIDKEVQKQSEDEYRFFRDLSIVNSTLKNLKDIFKREVDKMN